MSTPSWNSACVPIANCASPLASAAIAAFALLRRQRAGKPRDAHAQAFEPQRQLAVVLLGEDFRRRHERDLLARFDGLQRGQRRDDRLAGADVALQQPLHRRRALQVMRDLAPHALLRARQLERHALEQLPRQRARAGQHRRPAQRARLPMRLERQLLREQFVELEPRPRRMRARIERVLRQLRSGAAAACAGSAPRRRTSRACGATSATPAAIPRSAPDRRRAFARRPCAASPAPGPPSSDTRASGGRSSGVSSATTLNCGWTISSPKWPSRTSPNTRTRWPGASTFCWLG